ncbi:hypothetical protein O6H91_04G071800 [Diphasiastrum complanatum]|uniref:Uncharacterized protein n=1 Tax=Diphasiastrum complanatum TaxID=34168 RepID=A0ACC2DY56_DIPCM|nr:hypothetical protein O6H91_04G071800 [Diphasiastrum complanatum]
MGKPSTGLVCLIFLFHLIAFGLAVGAETRRTTVTWEYDSVGQYYFCKYKLDIASGLAAGGFIFNLLSLVVIMGVTRCFCCGGPYDSGASRSCAIVSLALLWLCFLIAEACFLAGANRNQMRTNTEFFKGTLIPDCETISKGVFAAAAAFTFFSGILSEVYYICTTKSRLDNPQGPARTVGMTTFSQQSPYSL